MARADQDALLRWALAALDCVDGADRPDARPAPPSLGGLEQLPLPALQAAGLATGLTALVGTLAAELGVALPGAWRPFVDDQVIEVARRQERFAALLPRVLEPLRRAGVAAVPLKGAVLSAEVWPRPACRPMADIDLLVGPHQRAATAAALESAGFAHDGTSPWEDVFLGWGDGGVGRSGGESADHNGKIEVHPGWTERLHHYLVDDGGALMAAAVPGELAGLPCSRLPPAPFAAHVVGHLSASVVRAEVRALNVIDAVLLLQRLSASDRAELAALSVRLDPRLVAPGLWLVARHRPEVVPLDVLGNGLGRLPPAAASLLASTESDAVLRDLDARTGWAWRRAFTAHAAERAAMARQFVWPPAVDLRGPASDGPLWRLRADRAVRMARRAVSAASARFRRP